MPGVRWTLKGWPSAWRRVLQPCAQRGLRSRTSGLSVAHGVPEPIVRLLARHRPLRHLDPRPPARLRRIHRAVQGQRCAQRIRQLPGQPPGTAPERPQLRHRVRQRQPAGRRRHGPGLRRRQRDAHPPRQLPPSPPMAPRPASSPLTHRRYTYPRNRRVSGVVSIGSPSRHNR